MIHKKKTKKMTAATLMARTGNIRIKKVAGKMVAILPFKAWEEIEDYLEELAMSESLTWKAKIKKARAEKKLYPFEEVVKRLGH